MDPSAAGVTKQMMLDWLRINHPMVPVLSHTRKARVAEIVREKQPELFADPKSDAPAAIPGGSKSDTPNPFQTNPPVSSVSPQAVPEQELTEQFELHESLHEVPRPSTVSQHQVKRSRSPSSTEKPSKRPTFAWPASSEEAPQLLNVSEHPVKRPASLTPHEPLPKRANIGDQGLLQRKPPKKDRKKLRESYPLGDLSRSSHWGSSKTTSVVKGLDINLLDRGSPEDLKALLGYEVAPMNPSNPSNIDRSGSAMHETKNIVTTPENPEIRDLIDLSGVDLLSVENLAITEDINLRKIPTLVKSGVEVFEEERRRAQIVSELEKSVSHLLNRMDLMEEKSAANIVEHEQQRYEQDHTLEQATCRLDEQAKCIDGLRDTVSSLKQQLDLLHRRLNRAEQDIATQERCIVRLMQQDNGDEGTDTEEGFNIPEVDSQSDYSE